MQEGENCRSSEEDGGWGGGGYVELTSENCRSNYPLIAFLLPYFLPVCRIKNCLKEQLLNCVTSSIQFHHSKAFHRYCIVYSIMRKREYNFIEAIAKTFTLNFQASINFKNHQRTDLIAERPPKQISSRDPIFLRGGGEAYGVVKRKCEKAGSL
jgi:hypothetical protein